MIRASLLALALALLAPALAAAGDDPPPGSCGDLEAEVVPVTSLDLGAVSIKCANCLAVRLTWSEAPQLDFNDWKGYYGVEADWGDGLRYMPFSLWDRRSVTYDWGLDWQDHADGLTGRTWNFQVGAFRDNAKAEGPKSTTSIYVPGPLTAPTNPVGVRASGGVKLTWQAPAGRAGSQGGAPTTVDRYIVTRLDETPDGLVETTVGEPTTPEFTDTDTVRSDKGIPYYVYPLDKFGVGKSAYVFVPKEETVDPPAGSSGCATVPGGFAPGLVLLLLGLPLRTLRRRAGR